MLNKITLKKKEVIVFMGSMNSMPMMYALELKKLGYEVIYFVDAPKKNMLSRPESAFPNIEYPYPRWIFELVLPSQILLSLFPRLFALYYQLKLKRLTKGKRIGCFVLNGFFVSLAPYLDASTNKVGLSHGSDLDEWADTDNAQALQYTFSNKSIFKYLPSRCSEKLIRYVIGHQFEGYKRSDTVVYFPMGFSPYGDRVVRTLINHGVRYVQRHDISFDVLRTQSRDYKKPSEVLEIFSGVRFLFGKFAYGDSRVSLGNDLIIEGIAKYFSTNKNIRVHFVEKGGDVQSAKTLCCKLGLDNVVVWHKEMPFKSLLALYERSDICFDQLGGHWIGAIGGNALWLGKPLIANAEKAIRAGIWPVDNPVCSARTSDEVCEWLIKLENNEFRKSVSEASKIFAEAYMGPTKALKFIFDI